MGNLLTDLRLAVRAMAHNPFGTLLIVLVLAIGIGTNSAIFALVNILLLRPLPVERPDELMSVF